LWMTRFIEVLDLEMFLLRITFSLMVNQEEGKVPPRNRCPSLQSLT
jgi:hypothetical protein